MKNFKYMAELKEFYSYHLDFTIVLLYLFSYTSLCRFFLILIVVFVVLQKYLSVLSVPRF